MLHAGGLRVAVHKPEVEQTQPYGRGHLYALVSVFVPRKGYVAQPAGFRAGDPQTAVTRLDNAGGLGKPCVLGGTVLQPFNPGARKNTDGFRNGVVAEELVGASHRDHELPGFTRVDRIPRG